MGTGPGAYWTRRVLDQARLLLAQPVHVARALVLRHVQLEGGAEGHALAAHLARHALAAAAAAAQAAAATAQAAARPAETRARACRAPAVRAAAAPAAAPSAGAAEPMHAALPKARLHAREQTLSLWGVLL